MKSFLASVALFAICASVTARAADLPVKARPIPAPLYNWNGFYIGANFGGAWTNGSLNIPGNNLYGGTTEFMAGVQAGYNFQAGHFLFGVEGDFDGATFGHFALPTPTLGTVQQNWIGTIAGRFGLVEDKWLFYTKLGGGWVHSNASLNFPGVSWQGSNTSSGWLAGVGIEYGFKYFQQVNGTIMLPGGFQANRVRVHADGDAGHIEQDFAWNDAIKGEEGDDVRK